MSSKSRAVVKARVASVETVEAPHEEFDIRMDVGYISEENALSSVKTLRAITVRALDRATLREWSATLEQFSHELYEEPTLEHRLFTCENIVHIVEQLIKRKEVKIMQSPHTAQQQDSKKSAPIIAIFAVSMHCDHFLLDIKDELELTLESVAQTDTEMAFKQ